MATIESPEKSQKKKKGLLGDMNDRLGLGEGSETIAPRLREVAQQLGPLGLPFAADIGLEQQKAGGLVSILGSSPAMDAQARMTGRKKGQLLNNAVTANLGLH